MKFAVPHFILWKYDQPKHVNFTAAGYVVERSKVNMLI